MVPDAEAYRRREIGSKRMEEEAKKIQPLRPLSAAETDDQYPLAAKGGSIKRFDAGGSNSISLDDLNAALRDRAPTIPEQFNRYIAPHIQRGMDAMFPFRQLIQRKFENNVYNPLNESVINNIGAAIKTSGTNAGDVNDAKIHIANAARKAVGMAPQPIAFDPKKALGDINTGEFDPENVSSDKNYERLLEAFLKKRAQPKASGGVIDMDRMRLELMNGKKKFLEPSKIKERLYRGQRKSPKPDRFVTTQDRATPSFTTDPEVANVYSRQLDWNVEHGPGSTSVPVHIQSEKPFDIRNLGEHLTLSELIDQMDHDLTKPTHPKKLGYEDLADILGTLDHHVFKGNAKHSIDARDSKGYKIKGFDRLADEVMAAGKKKDIDRILYELLPDASVDAYALADSPEVVHQLKKQGYDSMIHKDVFDAGMPYYQGDKSKIEEGYDAEHVIDAYRPFHQNKIKSAIGNRGTYDTTNPDITKAKGGSVKEPKNTVKAYKLFRVHPKHPGKLFPLFVNANEPVEMNKWVDAKEGEMAGDKVKSKIGPLAYRPGWHAGDLPVATHIGEKSDPNLTAPDVRPANHVWAEVEMPHDVDWQSVANERGMNPKGKLIARNAHITDQIPKGGHYRYKTNSNMTGNWLIGGSMKVNRVLQDKEVKAINKAAGAADLPRTRPFKAKDYGFASGGVVAPEEFMAEEHVNYKTKGGSVIKKLEAHIKDREGQYGLQRLQRAADEIPHLGRMYSEEALRSAFSGDNAKALMTMNPSDFEKYAEKLRNTIGDEDITNESRDYGNNLPYMTRDQYIRYLAKLKGGFSSVPFLEVEKRKPEYLPSIEGHEGRHRSRSMSKKGINKSLVQLLPTAKMREPMPRRYREDFIEAMKKELGEKRLVTPEGRSLLPADLTAQEHRNLENRNLLAANRPQLPEVYKSGGATHAHHLDIEERPL